MSTEKEPPMNKTDDAVTQEEGPPKEGSFKDFWVCTHSRDLYYQLLTVRFRGYSAMLTSTIGA